MESIRLINPRVAQRRSHEPARWQPSPAWLIEKARQGIAACDRALSTPTHACADCGDRMAGADCVNKCREWRRIEARARQLPFGVITESQLGRAVAAIKRG